MNINPEVVKQSALRQATSFLLCVRLLRIMISFLGSNGIFCSM